MVDRSLTLGTLFTANIQQFISKIDLMKRKVGQLNATMASVGKQTKGFATATGSVDKMGKSMDKTAKSTKGFAAQMGFMGKALTNVGMAAKTTASFFAAGLAIGAITKGLAAGTKEIIDFDQALKNLQAITKSTDAEVLGMGEVIKKVATETKFSTGEVAEGMVLLGQAGFSVTEAMQSMSSVANLATGTLSNLRVTSDLLTTAIRAFGLSTVESARVSDVMANAINRSKLTIDKLRIAFNFVGAASAQAGLSIEETAASMMVLANHGLRASTIGTGLRQVMARLLAPNRKLREEFKEQGIALERVNPATQGWSNALKNLIPVLINSETGLVDMAKAYQLFGLRGAQAAAILAKAVASGNYEKMIEFTMEVGSSARMAETQMEGLGVKLKNLADRMKLVAVAIGEAGLTDALKLLVDALRATAKAVADFISSDVGKVVLAFAGWTIAIGGVIKIFRVLVLGIGFAGRAIKGVLTGALIGASGTAVTAATSLGKLALGAIKLVRAFSGIGVVVGAVLTITRHFVNSIKVEIQELEKFDTKTQTVIQTLSLYRTKLEELVDKKNKDIDVTKQHAHLIERFQVALKELEKDYVKLDISIDENTDSLEDNVQAIRDLEKTELEKSVRANIVLIEKYNKQIERTKYWLEVWNRVQYDTIGWLNNMWKTLNKVGNIMIDSTAKGAKTLGDELRELSPITAKLVESFEFLGEQIKEFWDGVKGRISEIAGSYEGDSKKIVSLTDAQRDAFVRAARGLDTLAGGSRNIESIIEELETLSNMKIDPQGVDAINEALSKVSRTLLEQKEEWKETFEDLPTFFKDMYKDMDVNRKVDFVKFAKDLVAKEAAWEKTAKVLGATDAEITAGRAVLRAEQLREYEEQADKEVKIEEKKVDAILATNKYAVDQEEASYDKRTTNAINAYLREYDEATKSKNQLIKVEEEFSKQMTKIAADREASLTGLGTSRNKVLTDLERQTVKEITKLNEKMYKDLKSQLNTQMKEAKKALKDTEKDIADLGKNRRESLRAINQLIMTDEEKWLDDRQEVQLLFNKAIETQDQKTYEEAIKLAENLAREVKDSKGEVVRTLMDTQVEAKDLLLQLYNEQEGGLKESAAKQKQAIREIGDSIVEVDTKLVDLYKKVENLNSLELKLEMEESLRNMKEMYDITSEFKDDWEALKSKIITLTVKYKHVEAPPQSEKRTVDDEAADVAEDIETERWGGLIKRKLGGAIRSAFDIGGRLRGYGGGDKVKALLEPGEYVVRKEAVKKYGEGVFSALNNMKMASEDVGSTVAQKIGGIIKRATYQPGPVQAFAGGGSVASASNFEPARAINVYLQPKFLTGDRSSMRTAAVEIQRALTDLDSRWGKR